MVLFVYILQEELHLPAPEAIARCLWRLQEHKNQCSDEQQ